MHASLCAAVVLAASLLAAAPALAAPTPIHEEGFVSINGAPEWVSIQGDDIANPVLLVLHGGPGSTWYPLSKLYDPWRRRFTVVLWDQPGAGRSYTRNGGGSATGLTIDGAVRDGLAVARYVESRLHKHRILLLGHSWGSLIGVLMVRQRPELFSAYVGTGQVVNVLAGDQLGYAEVMRRAVAAKDAQAIAELTTIGAPPWDDVAKLATERKWEGVFAPAAEQRFNSLAYVQSLWPAAFTAKDMSDRNAGFFASNYAVFGARMDGPMTKVDLMATARAFRTPMIFIQGDADDVTPTSLVEAYAGHIQAPYKRFVVLAGGGHLTVMTDPAAFLAAMLRALPAESSRD